MAKTQITPLEFYSALVSAGILAADDMVSSVHISASSHAPYVEIEVEYVADNRLSDVIQELDFTEPIQP